jgi:hypothetical protein
MIQALWCCCECDSDVKVPVATRIDDLVRMQPVFFKAVCAKGTMQGTLGTQGHVR